MRAYVAILKDSFREALASRVLWIALIGIALVLLLLAPFGLNKDLATQLRSRELNNPDQLLKQLFDEREQTGTPSEHLWSILTDPQKGKITELAGEAEDKSSSGGSGRQRKRQLVEAINTLIDKEDLYDDAAWADVKLNDEAQQLVGIDGPVDEQLKRRNLLLVAAAFPGSIDIQDSQSLSLTYAGAEVIAAIPIPPSQFNQFFEQGVIGVLSVFLGFFGIFGSLLVTAGVIPKTFEPGEIALLLSKPVNRGLLFVTKFAGGCAFTLLYSTVLVVGIWFLLGVRMDYWQINLLWCIPVYLFLFMIYFCVSAVGGAIWRNSIVALVLVILFWVGLTVIEVAKQGLEENLITSRGIKEVVVAGETVLSVDGTKTTYEWSAEDSEWKPVFVEPSDAMSDFVKRFMGTNFRFEPVYDSGADRILALQLSAGRFGGIGAPQLVAGYREDDWERIPLGQLPQMAKQVFIDSDGRILLPAKDSIYEYVGQTEKERKRANFLGDLSFGFFGAGKAFETVHDNSMPAMSDSYAATLNPTNNAFYAFDKGKLYHLKADEAGVYASAGMVDLQVDKPGVLAATGAHGVLSLADGSVRMFDTDTLEVVSEFQLEAGVVPRLCAGSPDGKLLALLTHEKTVLLWDAVTAERITWTPPQDGNCNAVSFSPDGELLISDGRLAVHRFNVASGDSVGSWAEATTWVYPFYDNLIHPLWSVLPKPSQLDEFVPYVMSGEKTVVVNQRNGPPGVADVNSLEQPRQIFDVSRVIRNNALFILFMLGVGCFYVSRRDF